MLQFASKLLDQVWEKAGLIPGVDPALFRKDDQGTLIRKADFNNEASIYGWCFHHMKPIWEGGVSDIGNLQPLNCTNKVFSIAHMIDQADPDSQIWD